MDPNRGKADAGLIEVLPEMAFDLFEGKELPANLGKTNAPLIIVPEMAFDLQAATVGQPHAPEQGATTKSTELLDVEGTKRKNIIEMALAFTAMIRIFAKGSKTDIEWKLEEFFQSVADIRNRDDYESRHRSFCEWFTRNIRTHTGATSSYGQAAKILDVATKVYVYYCAQPTPEVADRIVPFLHSAIDTAIMKHLKKSGRAHGRIPGNTIKELDEEAYRTLQVLLAESRPESLRNLHPVEYDDILWRVFARGGQS